MAKIKYIETKEEWLKLILDGAKGVSRLIKEDNYCYWDGSKFRLYKDNFILVIELQDRDFGIIEEVEEVELFEYMNKGKHPASKWAIAHFLYTEEEAKVEFNYYEYRKTGRSFKVPKD